MNSTSPTTMIDREQLLLQINADLDKRFESFAKASRTVTPTASFTRSRIMPSKTNSTVKTNQNESKIADGRPSMNDNESGTCLSSKPSPVQMINKKPPAANTKANGLDELTRRNLSTDATLKFLKSKVCILQQELEKSRAEESNKSRLFVEQQDECKRAISNAERLAVQNAALNGQLDKLGKSLDATRELVKVVLRFCAF